MGGNVGSYVDQGLSSSTGGSEKDLVISLAQSRQIEVTKGYTKARSIKSFELTISDELEHLAGCYAPLLNPPRIPDGPHDCVLVFEICPPGGKSVGHVQNGLGGNVVGHRKHLPNDMLLVLPCLAQRLTPCQGILGPQGALNSWCHK